jgi:hypothetical protein
MEKIDYLDFDLLIDRVGKKHKARVINSPAGQAAAEFDAPFSAGELGAFWSKFEARLQKKEASPSDCKTTLKKFGEQLFAAVFANQVRSSFSASLHEASREGAGLRLRLRLTQAPELAALPWEFLHDPATNRFLSLSNQTPMVRYLDLPERIKPLAVQPPLRMLVMVSSPWDLPPLEVEQEWENVKSALAEAERRGLVQLERLETATLPALQKRLREKPFHLFHFIGHGDFDEAAQTGVLYVENEDKMKRAVSGDELGILLHDEETLRVAVLNACRGSRSADRDSFSGMAQRLVQQGIPAVIAMQAPISDTAALIFSQEFYSALAFGYPVDAAVSEARKAIFTQGNEVEWGTPVLFMRAPDGQIFDVAASPGEDRSSKIEDREKEARTSIQQSVSGAGGQVIQAGGDVIITGDVVGRDVIKHEVIITQPQSDAAEKKDIGKRLALWLGIVATALTIITVIVQLWPEVAPKSSLFFGDVYDAHNPDRGVAGAEIEVRAESGGAVIGTGKTNARGEFNFPIKENWEETVFVMVFKNDSVGCDTSLIVQGNQRIPFKPFKRKP